MKAVILSFLLLSLLYRGNSIADSCQAKKNSCDFYLCKEQKSPCGDKGYWLAYGYKYCSLFLEVEDKFPVTSMEWMQKVRVCLQKEINEFSEEISCTESYLKSMSSHVDCYTDTGFCQLSLKERASIIWALRSALLLPLTYVEGLELEYQCTIQGQNYNY